MAQQNGHSKHETPSHESLRFDSSLQPRSYHIKGTSNDSKIVFRNGREPFRGDVLIEGERFASVGVVPDIDAICGSPDVIVIDGKGRTLMSGMGDAHAHPTWDNVDLDLLGGIAAEEHVVVTARSVKCFLDSGYTM